VIQNDSTEQSDWLNFSCLISHFFPTMATTSQNIVPDKVEDGGKEDDDKKEGGGEVGIQDDDDADDDSEGDLIALN
jgi:hypothetical protein